MYLLPPWHTNTGKRLVKSPKLYFYDVGLACWLLGLRTSVQVFRDPLWGSLFENFIIMEALKDRLNAGESAEMYFYRDSEGDEVDLLLPAACCLLLENYTRLKSRRDPLSTRITSKALKTFASHHPQAIGGGSVVYGGVQSQTRSDWPAYSWQSLLIK